MIYLAPWEWFSIDGNDHWRSPDGDALSTLDLRTLAQQAAVGPTPQGYGVFAYAGARTITDSVALGEFLDDSLTGQQRNAIETRLGRAIPSQTTVLDFLWDTFTSASDPAGLLWPKPLRGGLTKPLRLRFQGAVVKQEAMSVDLAHRSRIIDVYREDYRRNRGDGTPLEALRRWTGSTCIKLIGTLDDSAADIIMPPEFRDDGWATPKTTITESFNTSDSDTLGPDLTWTEVEGDIDIVSNKASASGNDDSARAETDLSSDDHYAQAELTAGADSRGCGVICRYSSSAATFYIGGARRNAFDRFQLWKNVSGTNSEIGENNADTAWDGTASTFYLEVDGSDLELKQDGASRITLTDTSITGNLRCGIGNRLGVSAGNTVTWDVFEAADLAAGAAVGPGMYYRYYQSVVTGVI